MTIILTDEYTKGPLARAIPGAYWSRDDKAFVLDEDDVTPRHAAIALKLFPELNFRHPELAELRRELIQDVRPFDNATPYVKATGARLALDRVRPIVEAQRTAAGEPWSLNEYQEVDLAYADAVLREHKAFYLGWERGLGKTLGTCCLIDSLDCRATLVVAPNTAKDSVWGDELRRFCPWLAVIILGNSKAARARALRDALHCYLDDRPFALVVHYEALAVIAGKSRVESARTTTDGEPIMRTVLGKGWDAVGIDWDLLVTDEDHRLSNISSQMFKATRKVPAHMRLLLSGSIIQNHEEELYSPHNRAFPDRYTSKRRDWTDRFLDYATGGYGSVCIGVRPDRIPDLQAELGTWMAYRRKEDELDLPPKRYVERRVDLSPAQRQVYTDLQETMIAEIPGLDDETIKATAGAAMLTQLRRVATGLDLVGNVTDSSKLDLAVEMVKDGEDDEFVVFSWYKAGVVAMQERLAAAGIESFAVTGDVPQSHRNEMIQRFRKGEHRVFIGTLSTLGESVNLQRANQVIRLDRSFNPMTNVQAEDRVFRQGQTRNVTITDIIAKDTVDEFNVMPILANKTALRDAILGGSR